MTHTQTDSPASYDAWYHTPRGAWIGEREFRLLWDLFQPRTGERLLEVGSGSGYFSRRFSAAGLSVTGLEPDPAMRDFAMTHAESAKYIAGRAEALPFADAAFDYVAAITSLCFVQAPDDALREMWRVCRYGVVLGLLNRHSLLFLKKAGQGGYAGARWDTFQDVKQWLAGLEPKPADVRTRTGIVFPGGSVSARFTEKLVARWLPWGGFLAIWLGKTRHEFH